MWSAPTNSSQKIEAVWPSPSFSNSLWILIASSKFLALYSETKSANFSWANGFDGSVDWVGTTNIFAHEGTLIPNNLAKPWAFWPTIAGFNIPIFPSRNIPAPIFLTSDSLVTTYACWFLNSSTTLS